jgi:hypothetical protein
MDLDLSLSLTDNSEDNKDDDDIFAKLEEALKTNCKQNKLSLAGLKNLDTDLITNDIAQYGPPLGSGNFGTVYKIDENVALKNWE